MMPFKSKVISGFGRGGEIGFPTFNLEIPKELDQPFGIYAAKVVIGGKEYAGAMHYGPIPTFDHAKPSLEIFVLDFTETKKVTTLEFEVLEYIREIKKFDSVESLSAQIANDVSKVREVIKHGT